jgi:predicted XRE-type DNA-binding protein
MNLEKLNISQEDKNTLAQSALNQSRFLGLEYQVMASDDKSITLLIRQKRLVNDKILTKQELIERGKEFLIVPTLDPNLDLRIRPIIYNIAESEVVTSQWVQHKMLQHGLKLKNLVEIMGINKSSLSELVSGKENLTKWHKATFYYFFKALENTVSSTT